MKDHRVGIAELAAAGEGTLTTLGLGSCVAIALYDASARVAGLAHVLLPETSSPDGHASPARVAASAVPALLARMQELGADPSRMSARLVGGASMFSNLLPPAAPTIGARNVEAARRALADAGIAVTAEDVGEFHGRSVTLSATDGRMEVRSIARGTRVL
jgi:chemotaxis protein CheD